MYTPEEVSWLRKHGGRTAGHVHTDEGGKRFVLMYTPHHVFKTEKVYLPIVQEVSPRRED